MEDNVKYAVLGYINHDLWDELGPEGKRALHDASLAEHRIPASPPARVIAHYRFRPPRFATTIRLADDQITTAEGVANDASHALRALYLVESDDHDAVIALARRLPPLRLGATIEVWPLAVVPRHVVHPGLPG